MSHPSVKMMEDFGEDLIALSSGLEYCILYQQEPGYNTDTTQMHGSEDLIEVAALRHLSRSQRMRCP
jgi:hypothetical protein